MLKRRILAKDGKYSRESYAVDRSTFVRDERPRQDKVENLKLFIAVR